MASTYLTRTPSSAGNRKTFTFSCWFKRGNITSSYQRLFACYSDTNNRDEIYLHEQDDTITIESVVSSSAIVNVKTNRKFRDTNGWYHFVYTADTTQSTASDRIKIYINGVQETSFSTATYPSQNADLNFNNNIIHYIGRSGYSSGSNSYFDGCMSHIHFSDGYAYAPTVFGSTDSTTGEWKINTSPSFTLGTNGFTILKDGNTVTDQSANSNNFTVAGGTLTKTEDCPSNVFATWNPLNPTNPDFANGNATLTRASNSWKPAWTTIGASSGKYYCEIDWDSGSNFTVGFSTADVPGSNPTLEDLVGNPSNGGYITVLYENGVIYNNGSSAGAYGSGSTYATNDIMMLAMDLDNNKFYFGKNGTWFNSANPASNTGGYDINASYTNSTWCFAAVVYGTGSWHGNFGNGYFGTTQISSAGSNASGIGIFEYDVPTGYTALSTKGLNL